MMDHPHTHNTHHPQPLPAHNSSPPLGRSVNSPTRSVNSPRYLGSDDEQQAAGSDAATGAGADGLPVRQSQGADLQQLLAESEQFYGQAHFRYRSFIEAVDTEPPPVDVAAFEEELVLEPRPLIEALSKLPLTELLGIAVPAEFLQEGSWDAPPKVTVSSISSMPSTLQQQAAAGIAAPKVQPQQVQQPHLPPHLRQHQQPPPGARPAAQSQQQQQPAGVQPPHTRPAAAAVVSSKGEDDTDELLELLLTGKQQPPPPQQPTAAGLPPAAVGAGAHAVAAQGACSNAAARARVRPTGPSAPAAAGPAAAKPSAAAFDDELDALLGLGPPPAQPGAATQAAPAAEGGSSKKQSLEEWLDGF